MELNTIKNTNFIGSPSVSEKKIKHACLIIINNFPKNLSTKLFFPTGRKFSTFSDEFVFIFSFVKKLQLINLYATKRVLLVLLKWVQKKTSLLKWVLLKRVYF